jgi:phospholipid transport system substrate-binding protein
MRSVLNPFLALLLGLFLALPAAAQTNNAAEQFVAGNIGAGISILNDASLDAGTRNARFEAFLLDNTDLGRIAIFTLGNAPASPAQRDAFTAAFRDYAMAAWRSYFRNYSGQSLRVIGSRRNAPDDVIVHTLLSDGAAILPVDFRVRTEGPRPVVIDIGIAGVWLAVTQRDDFAAFLARNNNDVAELTSYLSQKARAVR